MASVVSNVQIIQSVSHLVAGSVFIIRFDFSVVGINLFPLLSHTLLPRMKRTNTCLKRTKLVSLRRASEVAGEPKANHNVSAYSKI